MKRMLIFLIAFFILISLKYAGSIKCEPPCETNQYCDEATRACVDCDPNCHYGCRGPDPNDCNPPPPSTSCVNLGDPCGPSNNNAQCCLGQGICAESNNQYYCRSCIPIGSTTFCYNNNQCCQGDEQLGGTTQEPVICKSYHKCEYCSSQNQQCGADSDCCSGLRCLNSKCLACVQQGQSCLADSDCCTGLVCRNNKCNPANSPPDQPAKPNIAPYQKDFLYSKGIATCNSNCPPSNLPSDPDGDPVTIKYLWYKNEYIMGGWSSTYSDFNCNEKRCKVGDKIVLKTIACDPYNKCSNPVSSDPLIVQSPAPNLQGFVPNIIAYPGPSLTTNTQAVCTNCPPRPFPIDPLTGTYASVYYIWVNNSVEINIGQNYRNFDCITEGCSIGGNIYLKVMACNSDSPPNCTTVSSNSLIVSQSSTPSTQTLDYSYAVLAILVAFGMLSVAYMLSYAFNMPHVRPIIRDEIFQVIATGAVLLGIGGIITFTDEYLKNSIEFASGQLYSDISGALDVSINKLNNLEGQASSLFNALIHQSRAVGNEASKGVFCNFLGVGYSLVNCNPINVFRGTLSLSSFAVFAGISDITAQKAILSFARNLSFTLLIPLGLFLRCFKFTREAGGALIAIGFGFYFVYPLSIIATDSLLHKNIPSGSSLPDIGQCNPYETDPGVGLGQVLRYAYRLSDFNLVSEYVYLIIVRIIFSSILNIMITLTFIRAFASFIGSEIDVSSLARIS